MDGKRVQVLKTGQTIKYANGDDGDLQKGADLPSPRFIDEGNETVMDNLTGLIWTKDADSPGRAQCCEKYLDSNMYWQQALNYVASLNSNKFLGHADWRLPNINELRSVIDLSQHSPALPSHHPFHNMQPASYWSSTTCALGGDDAWAVWLWEGGKSENVAKLDKVHYETCHVWPVRSGHCNSLNPSVICLPRTGQIKCYDSSGAEVTCAGTGQDGELQKGIPWPNPRFLINADATVRDALTDLIWSQDANIIATLDLNWLRKNKYTTGTENDGWVSWQHALDYVAKLNADNYAGHNDWRLPNINELRSLIDHSRRGPALPDGRPFTNVKAFPGYWSSTTVAFMQELAWIVDLWEGHSINQRKSNGSTKYVWPVCGG
jgi:hypothetical protein